MSGWFTTKDGRKFSPEQRKASAKKTKAAIAAGTFPEATKCNRCGQEEGYVSYHNHDYAHPTDHCESLCWRCHAMVHSEHFAPEQVAAYFEAVKQGKRWPPLQRPGWGALAREHGVIHPRERGLHKVTGDCSFCKQDKGLMRYWFGPKDDRAPVMLCWWCWAVANLSVDERNKKGVDRYRAEVLAGRKHEPAMAPQWEKVQAEYGIPTGLRGPQLAVDNENPERGVGA